MASVAISCDKPILSFGQRVAVLTRDIKVSHTVFALPFALLATFMASASVGRLPGLAAVGLIVVCMVSGRTAAMIANRFLDASLDRVNPRTRGRAIPSGRLSRQFVFVAGCLSAVVFVAGAGGFWMLDANPYPLILSPFVLAWLIMYSYTKRWTWLCHLFLGSALALSPLAAVIAIEPGYLMVSGPYLLAGVVACWVAGFDVIYALQDVDSDRETGVFSMPARLGVEPALWVSRTLHAVMLALLVGLCWISPMLGRGFGVGAAIVGGLIVLEHTLIWRSGTRHIHLAFFTLNGLVSLLLGALGVWDAVAFAHRV